MLHGFLENASIWQDISQILSIRYRVICIDLLGHGKTENVGYVHIMTEQAQMVKAVLKHLRLRKVVITGHSMGGYIAMAFAKLYPQNIKGVCLLNSTFLADAPDKISDRDKTIALVKKNPKTIIKMAIPGLFAEDTRDFFKLAIENILTEALKTSKQGIIAALEGMKIRENLTDTFKSGDFKKMVFIGQHDVAIKTKPLKKILSNISDVNVVLLSGGHMGFIENKEDVIENLKSFIKLTFR